MSTASHGSIGLVLTGGGARGAYQAGALRAIIEISNSLGIKQPVPIVAGVSAGAVNAAFFASMADDLSLAVDRMCDLWSNISPDQVFRTDAMTAGRSGLRFISDATLGALYRKKLARSLLDTTPLRGFLSEKIDFERIRKNVAEGHLKALAVTAVNYSNSTSITFVDAHSDAEMWSRSRRRSERATIARDHVMASAALPILFPPVMVGDDSYGDGCLRNTAPLSPAIHLGAERLLVISTRRPDPPGGKEHSGLDPSLARILGVLLNAVLMDAIEIDMERMNRINSTIGFIPDLQRQHLNLRKLDYLWIRPSRDIGELAGDLFNRLPRVIRYLVGGLGSSREASELTSYLLFDSVFCDRLVSMGYEDGLANREAISTFLSGSA